MGEWLNEELIASRAYLAIPDSGHGPGILVLHAWWGLTEVFTGVCDRLASGGFVALAPSLYPDGETTDSIAEAEQLIDAHDRDPELAKSILLKAMAQLRELPEVTTNQLGVIGFSMGGYWALHLSQAEPGNIRAVVTVYGTDDGDYAKARAAYLCHFAELDDYEPLEFVRSLDQRIRSAGREVTSHVYPGVRHWFVEPNRPDVYDAAEAELVWERTLAFFRNHLGH